MFHSQCLKISTKTKLDYIYGDTLLEMEMINIMTVSDESMYLWWFHAILTTRNIWWKWICSYLSIKSRLSVVMKGEKSWGYIFKWQHEKFKYLTSPPASTAISFASRLFFLRISHFSCRFRKFKSVACSSITASHRGDEDFISFAFSA